MPEILQPRAGPTLAIEEITGQRRSITLAGRAKPYWGSQFESTQRTKVTWYPGNPVATIQVLGPTLEPTSFEGTWKDRFVGASGSQVTGFDQPQLAEDFVQVFYELLRSGNTLRVQWGAEVRLGVLTSFKPTYDRAAPMDIQWSAEFTWSSYDQGAPRRLATGQASNSSTQLQQELNDLEDVRVFQPTNEQFQPTFNEGVDVDMASARVGAGNVFDALRVISQAETVAFAAVGALQSSAVSTSLAMQDAVMRYSAVPYTAYAVSDAVLDVLGVESWRRSMAFGFNAVGGVCLNASEAQVQRIGPLGTILVTVRQTMTLRQLALVYYGTADAWQVIADANGFSTSLVLPGTTVVIPPAGTAAAGAAAGAAST